MTDSCDGEIYRNFINDEAKLNHHNRSFTFSIFTDGIPLCKKSKVTIWPFLVVCNEIPPEDRFCIENVLVPGKHNLLTIMIIIQMILGVSVGHEKPVFEIFLKPIIEELKKLEYGLVVKINSKESKLLYFYVLFGIFDKPARAAILNMVNSTGYYGCLKCSQEGINYETKKGLCFI